MDDTTAWGLGLTAIGTIATIWSTIIAKQQATSAASSASVAIRARDQIVNQRRTSDLAELKVHCERALKSMEKYGPGASSSSLIGVSSQNDAQDVQTLLLEANRVRTLFTMNEVDLFVSRITPLLERFIDNSEQARLQFNGKALLMECSNFLSVVKSNLDNQRESISHEA